MAKAAARRATPSYVRPTPFVRGVIYGLFLAGYTLDEIREEVVKSDGAAPSRPTIAEIIRVAADRGNDPCEGVGNWNEWGRAPSYRCEDHFFEQNHRWYRCRNKGVDRRSGGMKCRAKASAGRATCDMPVRADAHLLAAAACV